MNVSENSKVSIKYNVMILLTDDKLKQVNAILYRKSLKLIVNYTIKCFFTDIVFLPGDKFYYPIVHFNDYWNLNSEYMPINSTTKLV